MATKSDTSENKEQETSGNTRERTKYSFSKVSRAYIQHMESLMEIFPLIMELLNTKMVQESEHVNEFIKRNDFQEAEEEEGKPKRLFIPQDKLREFSSLNDQVKASLLGISFIPSNFIVSFISQYDAYLGNLIRTIFEVKPEVLNTSEKHIMFTELINFNSIEEAKEYIIEKETETVLRESHLDQFKWIEKKVGMELRKDLPSFKDFIEMTERRNLFVHANGVVSRQYIQVCKENKVDNIDKVKVGNKLKVSPEYLHKCYSIMFEIGIKLSQVLWRKLQPEELEEADSELNRICYNLMLQKRYKLALNLLSFATETLRKHHDQEIVYTFIINKALVCYLSNKKDQANSILSTTDWSATSDKFKLALKVLHEDFESAAGLMISIGPNNNDVTKTAYREWPLFNSFRVTEPFKAAYKSIFGEEFIFIEDKPKKFKDIVNVMRDKTGDDIEQIDSTGEEITEVENEAIQQEVDTKKE